MYTSPPLNRGNLSSPPAKTDLTVDGPVRSIISLEDWSCDGRRFRPAMDTIEDKLSARSNLKLCQIGIVELPRSSICPHTDRILEGYMILTIVGVSSSGCYLLPLRREVILICESTVIGDWSLLRRSQSRHLASQHGAWVTAYS